jgi:nitrilase
VNLRDTPEGGGWAWVDKALEKPREGVTGDGTREELERIGRETGVFLVVPLYCT